MNHQLQEYMLIEDILYCMMSIEGNYIKKKQDILDKNKYNYCIEPYLEAPTCGEPLKIKYIYLSFKRNFTQTND